MILTLRNSRRHFAFLKEARRAETGKSASTSLAYYGIVSMITACFRLWESSVKNKLSDSALGEDTTEWLVGFLLIKKDANKPDPRTASK